MHQEVSIGIWFAVKPLSLSCSEHCANNHSRKHSDTKKIKLIMRCIMSVSGVSNTSFYQTNSAQTNFQQIRDSFQQLGQALQSGDLTAAQQAFAALQQLMPNLSAGSQTQTGQQGSGQNQFATDLSALSQALQSGDLTKAQDAFAKLQQDMQSVHKRHHHHSSGASQDSASSANNSSISNGTVTNTIDVTT